MTDIISHMGASYILTTSPRLSTRTLTLKQGDSFAVLDRFGDATQLGNMEQGVFHRGTRHLSHHEFRLGEQRPLLLSSTVHERNAFVAVDLTNPDLPLDAERYLARGTVHVFRSMFLYRGALFHRTRLTNYGEHGLESELFFYFDADFADLFEVRGMNRKKRGTKRWEQEDSSTIALIYQGLDGIERRTRIEFSDQPSALNELSARFPVRLGPHQSMDLFHTIAFDGTDKPEMPSLTAFSRQREALLEDFTGKDICDIHSSNDQFNHWLDRSRADLTMLSTRTEDGPYPYAGVPWFSTVFGRDGIITALQCLWVDPEMARGVLGTLARTQAQAEDGAADAEPGKILHEARDGEMAALGEIPFGRYYGSADSTPLFLMLAAAYLRRTGDLDFIQWLWPHLDRALDWIERHGDSNGDGLIDYARHGPNGLVNQGWKDSDDSVMHRDGRLAEGPIALIEVQAYAYSGLKGAATIAHRLGLEGRARELRALAEDLRLLVEERFWMTDLGTYALALDGHGQRCEVISSNPGHALFCQLPTPERARLVAGTLLSPGLFSGWGVRTLHEDSARYNPMSYHNGSIWPHDNALVAAGLARYGLTSQALRILAGMFDAALAVDMNRLPELFCGFPRQPGQGPTLYPVACIPQAWASGAVFMLLKAALGLSISADPPRITFNRPALPPFLPRLELRNLKVGGATVDLALTRQAASVGVHVLRRDGAVDISVVM